MKFPDGVSLSDSLDGYLSHFDCDYETLHQFSISDLEAFQLSMAQKLFSLNVERVPALARVALEQNVKTINDLSDVLRLLFPHPAYKSYSFNFIDQANYAQLTRWLQNFTAFDLSNSNLEKIDTIDGWIEVLCNDVNLKITHTFGTSGKLSFFPRSHIEWARGAEMLLRTLRDWEGPGSGPQLFENSLPVIFPSYRYGANAGARGAESLVRYVAKSESNTLFLYPDQGISADLGSLSARMQLAVARGQEHTLSIPPALRDRRDALYRNEESRAATMEAFFAEVIERYAGRDVYVFLLWPTAVQWAEAGLARGIRGLFGQNSIFHTGGGTKGHTFPEGWRERVFEFLGVNRCYEFYGMTEVYPPNKRCRSGNYHLSRFILPFVLDPKSGEPLPRTGKQTGRFAALDLNADSCWGGIVTGDRVTLGGWDTPCDCGEHGIYVDPDIQRYSELEGGSDKISCAGVPGAHERSLEFLMAAL